MTTNQSSAGAEVFRYARGEELRIYQLRVVPGGTELWRLTVRPGQPDHAIKEEDFRSADAAAAYFDEIHRTLTAGAWRQLSEFQP